MRTGDSQPQKGAEGAKKDPVFALCDVIRETAYDLHVYLKHGHFEKVYENGLVNRLRKKGVLVGQQVPLAVKDIDGTVLGEYFADLVVDDSIIVELKACKALCDDHVGQIIGYLRATGFVHGLLMNFGSPKFEIRKFALSQDNPSSFAHLAPSCG